jgi:glutamine cyclotransferase
MGWNDLKSIKAFFQNKKEASLELKDSKDLKTQDHFDVTKNTFSLNRLNEALDRARGECLRIVQKNSMLDTGIIETSN